MGCPRCGYLIELAPHELEGQHQDEPIRCPSCAGWSTIGELLIGTRHDLDDTERDHEGPFFWNI